MDDFGSSCKRTNVTTSLGRFSLNTLSTSQTILHYFKTKIRIKASVLILALALSRAAACSLLQGWEKQKRSGCHPQTQHIGGMAEQPLSGPVQLHCAPAQTQLEGHSFPARFYSVKTQKLVGARAAALAPCSTGAEPSRSLSPSCGFSSQI